MKTEPYPFALRALLLVSLGAIGTLGLGLVLGGAAEPLPLADPGVVVRLGQPITKLVLNLSMATAIGALVLASFAANDQERSRLQPVASWAAALWLFAAAANFVMTYLSASGSAVSYGPQFSEGLWLFATQIELGTLLAFNLGFAFLLSLTMIAFGGRRMTAINAAIGMAGLYPLAESGHASSDSGHALAVNSLLMHLVGISVWVGGLIALYAVFRAGSERTEVLVSRYSTLALAAFILVGVSGITSGFIRLFSPEDIFGPYGLLLIGKAILLTTLGLFGARYRLGALSKISASASGFWRLVTVELLIMGAAVGLGTALATTALPEDPAEFVPPTPAQLLTGDPLPPELTPSAWLTVWDIDILWLSIAVGAIVLYLYGVARLRSRGDSWPVGRTISWVSGMLVLVYVTNGAPNAYQEFMFSTHMVGHMILSMMVPVLLVPGAPVTLLSRAQPARKDGSWGLREWVLWAVHTPYAWFISHPLFAGLNFALSLVMFYYTPLFRWSTEEHLGHQWMLVHFLITGYLFVQALIGVDPQPHRPSYPLKLMLLIGTMAFHAFFGLSLMNEKSLLLADWFGSMGRTWGDDPLTDQAVGGAFAWGVGEIPTIVITTIVVWQWARSDDRERRRLDRASDRSGNKDLEDYNAMLESLNRTRDSR
ncbi:MAG: copper transporter [Candidatus Aquiluna sp. XM-24bin5]|nr:MAG: copper transporter [Candidatus Aquiluna sp. XM-24bin5]